MQTGEKKLINIFKIFIDKAIIPQIRKFEGSLAQWSKFCSLLLTENLNYNELQYFVDTLPIWGSTNNEKLQVLSKKQELDNIQTVFNPSKTFGGERNKIMYNLSDDKPDPLDSRRQSQRDQSLRQRVSQNNLNILSNLDKLLKSLEENQNIIDGIPKEIPNQGTRINRQPTVQYNTSQNTNGFTSHSYNYIPGNQPHILNSQNLSQTQSHSSHSQPHSHSQSYSHVQAPTYIKNYY